MECWEIWMKEYDYICNATRLYHKLLHLGTLLLRAAMMIIRRLDSRRAI